MRSFQRILTLALILSMLAAFSFAFDTGSHQDLTRSVLKDRGFAEDGIKVVQVENWLTDYYSNSPTYKKDRRAVLEKLHFDNLYTAQQVENYWVTFTNNLSTAAENAARDNDKITMLVILGIGLHAVQDFYSHSNWVETHQRMDANSYRTDTYRGLSGSLPKDLHTGKYPADRKTGPGNESPPVATDLHGDYDSGLNHDSPSRPRWDEAYVFAYAASNELVSWLEKVTERVRPGFWQGVKAYSAEGIDKKKLDYDVEAARNISMWFKGEGQDGHWKGSGSGSARFFSAFSSKWVGSDSSIFVRALRDGKIQAVIANGLYVSSKPTSMSVIDRIRPIKRAVLFQVTSIAESKDAALFGKLPKTGGTDFYSRITIGEQEYWGRTRQASRESIDPWTEMAFVDQSLQAVPITISIYDEDNTDFKKDQLIDINPLLGKRNADLLFRFSDSTLTGHVTGTFISNSSPFTLTGTKPDDRRATLKAFVTTTLLK